MEDIVGGNEPRKNSNGTVRGIVLGAVTALVILLIALAVVFTVGLYKFGWSGPVVTSIVQTLPFPAASVNGESLSYAEYLEDTRTLKDFFDRQVTEQGANPDSQPTLEEIKRNSLDRMVYMAVMRQEAKRLDVSVSDEELEAEYATLIQRMGSEEAVEEELMSVYGWGPEKFKQKVLVPFLLQDKLGPALREGTEEGREAKAMAESLLQQLRDGSDFAELAKASSEDTGSGAEGGDLGWFGRGEMVAPFEEVAFSLEPGVLSDLVETQYGWHIIRVEEVEDNEDGVRARVHARHILIMAPDAAEWLEQQVDEANVEEYVKI